MRKIISIMLALVMTLSLCVTTTWADEPMVLAAADTPTYDWYTGDTTATTFTLSTMSDYLGFVKLTQGAVDGVTTAATDFANTTVKLGCDIDFSGMNYLHRDTAGNIDADLRIVNFKGTFDGQDHTLRNLTYKDEYTSDSSCGMGVFKTVYGTVKNLKVDGVTVTSASPIGFGGIAYNSAKKDEGEENLTGLYNCHVSNVNITITASAFNQNPIGGLAGQVFDNNEVKNCTVTNFTVTASNTVYNVGGLIGRFYIGAQNSSTGKLENCKVNGFTANVAALAGHNSGTTKSDFGGIGGMLGYGHSGNDGYAFPITNCHVTGANITVGEMYDDSFVGGFLGMSRRRYAATNCSAQGTITVDGPATGCTKCYVGGFCGSPTGADVDKMLKWGLTEGESAVTFTNCTANVNISAPGCTTGGFAGLVGGSFKNDGDYSKKNTAKFDNCTANGTINGATGATGAFTGNDVNRGTYTGCAASGATNEDNLGFFGGTVPTGAPKMAKLLFDLTGGTGTTFVVAAEGSVIDLTKYVPTRNGYSFVGWVEKADTTEPLLTKYTMPGGESADETENDVVVTLAENEPSNGNNDAAETVEMKTATLYAVWEEIPEVPHQHTRRQPTTTTTVVTPDTTTTDTVTSAKTFDAGVAVYAVMGVLSLTGSAWVVGKKRG